LFGRRRGVANEISELDLIFAKDNAIAVFQNTAFDSVVVYESSICAAQIYQLMALGCSNHFCVTPGDMHVRHDQVGITFSANDDFSGRDQKYLIPAIHSFPFQARGSHC
jgi:hypothetical protein